MFFSFFFRFYLLYFGRLIWKEINENLKKNNTAKRRILKYEKFHIAQWNIKSVIGGIFEAFSYDYTYGVFFLFWIGKKQTHSRSDCNMWYLYFGVCFFFCPDKFKVNWISITEMYRLAKCEKQIPVFLKFVWEFLKWLWGVVCNRGYIMWYGSNVYYVVEVA